MEAPGLSAAHRHHHQFRAVPQVGNMLAVRGNFYLEGSLSLRAYTLLLEGGAVGEALVLFVHKRALVDAPAAVSL